MVEAIFLLENVKYFSENKSYIINFQEKSFKNQQNMQTNMRQFIKLEKKKRKEKLMFYISNIQSKKPKTTHTQL